MKNKTATKIVDRSLDIGCLGCVWMVVMAAVGSTFLVYWLFKAVMK